MRSSLFSTLTICLLLNATIACNPHSKNETRNEIPDSPRPLYLGALDEKLSEIYSKEYESNFDPCDFKNRDRIFEVARALEEKRNEIESFVKSLPTSPNQELKNFGRFKLIDDTNNLAGENKWSTYNYAWTDVFSYYDQIKNSPIDKNWVSLNKFARGFVPNDEGRIINLRFGGLSRSAGPKFEAILIKVQNCINDESCIDPKLDDTQKTFLNTNLAFNYYNEILSSPTASQTDKRNILQRFFKRVKMENNYFEFHLNPIAKIEGNTLVIPMDLSILGETSTGFIEILEKAWNIDNDKNIKIKTQTRPTASYLLKLDDVIGGRAFVQYNDGGSMQLFNFSRLKTATHEFGHVIGLTDEYFTSWDTTKCSYVDEYNSGNLMSDSFTGKVLPEHWQLIKKTYWK
jgi:hypothetical protein